MPLTYDINECAEFLKIEKQTALSLAAEGKLPGAKVGRAWVFLVDDLVEYLRQQVRLQQRERCARAEVLAEVAHGFSCAINTESIQRGRKRKNVVVDFAKYEEQLPKATGKV